MEIIKEIKLKDRKNKIEIEIKRGVQISLKLKDKKELIVGKCVKQHGENFKLEIGKKKAKINISIPKRRHIIEDIKIKK